MKFPSRQLLQIAADGLLFAVSITFAFFWRYDLALPPEQLKYLLIVMLPVAIVKLAVFCLARVYRIIWRYVSIMDFFRIAVANMIGSLVTVALVYFAFQYPVARGVMALDCLLAMASTAGVRFAYRLSNRLNRRLLWKVDARPALIVGAGDTGAEIAREITRSRKFNIDVVGFIDDDPRKMGMSIHGIRVLGNHGQLPQLLTKHGIAEVIVCIPSASRMVIKEIVTSCQTAGVRCRTLPGIYQLVDGTVTIAQLRDVQVQDILGREPVQVDLESISGYIAGKSIMVIGAGGSIGAELSRQVSRMGPASLTVLDQCEGWLYEIEQELLASKPAHTLKSVIADITNGMRMGRIFSECKPQVVFHAAAYKHVPLMESNLLEAVENNIFGTRTLCDLAVEYSVERFVFISSDKAIEPSNTMGLSKAICEKVVHCCCANGRTRFMSVRFGNVLDSSGSVVPIFRNQIMAGGPVTVTHPEMMRFFMTIPEAVQLVIQAGAFGGNGEIFILDMGEQVSIDELARNMIRLQGYEPGKDIAIEYTGIRPGEKLYEKLSWDYEETTPTANSKILMVKNSEPDCDRFRLDLEALKSASAAGDDAAVRRALNDISESHLHYRLHRE